MSGPVLIIVIGAVWLTIGLVLSLVLGRRGHDGFTWLVIGTLLGPLALLLALDAVQNGEPAEPLVSTPTGIVPDGGIDVLVGADGSDEARAALEEAVAPVRHEGRSRPARPGGAVRRRGRHRTRGDRARSRPRPRAVRVPPPGHRGRPGQPRPRPHGPGGRRRLRRAGRRDPWIGPPPLRQHRTRARVIESRAGPAARRRIPAAHTCGADGRPGRTGA